MAFSDALQDSATFKTISYTTSTAGEQTKGETALYTNVPCRLHKTAAQTRVEADIGKINSFSELWTMLVAPAYNGAVRGDRVITKSKTFIIVGKNEVRGRSAEIHHVVYTLEEQS